MLKKCCFFKCFFISDSDSSSSQEPQSPNLATRESAIAELKDYLKDKSYNSSQVVASCMQTGKTKAVEEPPLQTELPLYEQDDDSFVLKDAGVVIVI